jgi:hypothetical protein
MNQKIGLQEIRGIAEEALRIMYGDIEGLSITFCVQDKGEWRVNILFRKPGDLWDRSALFRIDSQTGEVKEFKEGMVWTA